MIRKAFLILLLLLTSQYVYSNDDLEMHGVTLHELTKLIFVHLNRIDFVAEPDFINDQKGYDVIFKNLSSRQQKLEVINLIKRAGYYVDTSKRIIRISKKDYKEPEQKQPFVYKPKFRDPNYIINQLSSVMNGDFTVSRQIDTQTPQQPRNFKDTGTSAFSQITKATDLLVLNTDHQKLATFKRLIKEIDIPEPQVQINAFMYEVKKSENQKSSFALILDLFKGKLGLEFNADTSSNAFKVNLPNLKAVLSVLNSNSNFKLLSSPFILAKNNHKSSFNVGSEVPVLGNVTQNANGQSIQSVDYRQAGVILDITPKILQENIELTINHQISNFVLTDTGVNNTPTLIKREFSSVLNAKNNDLILLGGLNEATHSYNENKLPFLSAFFDGKSEDTENTEIMLLLSVKRI